jgi:hypothetical protein
VILDDLSAWLDERLSDHAAIEAVDVQSRPFTL